MNGISVSAEKPATTVESPLKNEEKAKKSSVLEKLMQIKSNITVEPIIACYIMSNVFSGLAMQNLCLEKACRVNLGYSDEVCSALNRRQTANYTVEEAEVQKLTASVQAWKNVVQTTFPCILVLFVGSWSDKTGKRKACILLPIVGEVLCCTGFILNTYFFYELPLEVTALSDLFPSLTGGWITVCVGVFSYIGDVTTKEMRTFRVGVANLCMSLGIPIGMSLSGILLQQIGYYGIFLISNCLYLASLTYGYIRLKDPIISEGRQTEHPVGCRGWVCSFFDARHVRETLTVAFRSGPRRRRLRVSLLIVVVCVIFGPLHGEMNVLYLFMRYRFNWDEVQFSMFCTYSIITNLVGTLFSISIFSDFMKLDDTVVGIISCTSKILASFIFAFATTTVEIYIAPLVEIFNGTSFIAMRSIASKLVTSEELGKVNSLFGLAEAMMPLVYGPLYSRVYMATLNVLPGAVFLLGAGMTVPAVAIFGYVKSNITVEPVLAMFVMPSMLAMLATQNLNLDKACQVNLGFGDEVCRDLRLRKRANHTYEEDEVQKLIASVQAWKSVVHTAVPTLLMLFIGAWSDKTGKRKICMLMPIFGEFMTCLLNMLNTYLFYEVPVELTVFMEVIFPALTGGWYTMFLGTFSYLGDITSRETRTFRMGLLSLCMTIGFPIGMGLSGVLLRYLGYYGVFSISAMFQFLNFCYVYFTIEDHTWLENKEKVKKTGCTGFLLEFFDIHSLKETFEIAFKKGANNRRLRICLILTVVCLTFGPMWGEISIMYLFTRYRFNWDEVKYSIYSTYSLITHSVGTLFSIGVFSKTLKVDDSVLGIISTSSKVCGALVLAFARTDVEAYMSPLLEILNGTTAIALRSIASKLVSYQELGKVFSLFGVAETTMPLIFAPLYSRVYLLTLKVLPGAVFLLSVLATLPSIGIFIWFYCEHKRDRKEKRLNAAEGPPLPNDPPVVPA